MVIAEEVAMPRSGSQRLRQYLAAWPARLRSVGAWARDEFDVAGVEGPLSVYACVLAPEIAPVASLLALQRVAATPAAPRPTARQSAAGELGGR